MHGDGLRSTVTVDVTVETVVLPAPQPASARTRDEGAAMRIDATVLRAAVGADPGDLDAVVGGDEAVPLRGLVHPAVEVAFLHLDDTMAALADEVVVVCLAAEAVALLAAVVGEDVDDARIAQEGERAVDRRQAGRRVAARVAGSRAPARSRRPAPGASSSSTSSRRGVARTPLPLEQSREVLRRAGFTCHYSSLECD